MSDFEHIVSDFRTHRATTCTIFVLIGPEVRRRPIFAKKTADRVGRRKSRSVLFALFKGMHKDTKTIPKKQAFFYIILAR